MPVHCVSLQNAPISWSIRLTVNFENIFLEKQDGNIYQRDKEHSYM